MTYEQYAALPGLRASELKAATKSMAHAKATIDGLLPASSNSLRFGRLFHASILENKLFLSKITLWKGGRRYGKTWDAFLEEAGGSDEWILDSDELAALTAMSVSVHADADAHHCVVGTEHEVVLQWSDPLYGKAKARLDGYNASIGLLELKSTRSIGKRNVDGSFDGSAFQKQAHNLGYYQQLGWYAEGLAKNEKPCQRVTLVAVETSPPYCIVVYEVPAHVIEQGREQALKLATQYRACEAMGVYPGVASERQILEMPEWARGSDEVELEGCEDE